MDEPRFQHLYDMTVQLEPPQMIGQTPQGNRQIFYVRSGTFEGPRLKGELPPGGAAYWRSASVPRCPEASPTACSPWPDPLPVTVDRLTPVRAFDKVNGC